MRTIRCQEANYLDRRGPKLSESHIFQEANAAVTVFDYGEVQYKEFNPVI